MYGYIYKTTCIVNNIIYIGQKKSDKFLELKYLGSGKILKCAIRKYGRDNFKVELIEECNSFDELNEREIYWIYYYNSTNPDIGYNITLGGQGFKGCDSGYHLGMLGKHQSDYLKLRIREYMSTYVMSDETRAKLSRSKTGVPVPSKYKKVRCVELDRVFESVLSAQLFLIDTTGHGGHITAVCQGFRNKAGGYTWEFVNN